MKKSIINSLAGVALIASFTGCSETWLEDTKLYSGVDSETALNNVTAIGYALNGTYYQLHRAYFAGNYATMIGDVASDIVFHNTGTSHFTAEHTFTYTDTDTYLYYIWYYGYKVVDNAARVIQAAEAILPEASTADAQELKLYEAEARCLRAYANLSMVNVFCHQVKVAGQDYSSQPGLVLVDEPVEAYSEVTRSTVGETYNFILADLQEAISLFTSVGDQGSVYYFNLAAAYGLQARANMYLENWSAAATAAQNALSTSGITTLTYTDTAYKALYAGGNSNTESFFTLGINSTTNWSANSCGTLFSTYGYSYSPYLWSLYGEDDVRKSVMYWDYSTSDNEFMNNFSGGKFYYNGGNSAYATNYLINAPEMFLIEAEAYANSSQLASAQEALLVVAKRNPAITSVSDLPSSTSSLIEFLYEERARELFQEGFRLWDLRRWNISCNLWATDAPNIAYLINGVTLGDQIYPIPADEINAGFGVTQNEGWESARPS